MSITSCYDKNQSQLNEAIPMTVSRVRFLIHQAARKLFPCFRQGQRHGIYRSFVDCDPAPNERLVLKIADTKEELEACFKLLHDAYVSSGFMTPDPSGMRVTIYTPCRPPRPSAPN
jgi:hypothetical protein